MEIFEKVSSEALVGFAGVLFGSLLTTLGVWLTNRSNAKQSFQRMQHEERVASDKVRKERLEELYVLVCHWSTLFFSHYANLRLVMKGTIDYNNYLDIINKDSKGGYEFGRIEMIIRVYGDDKILSYYKAVEVARKEVNLVNSEHKKAYMRGDSGQPFLEHADHAQFALGDKLDELKLSIAEAART
ncbi:MULTISPECIES: hypothetical protein [unclassified Pseudomonas]|uniref:hypothetical protein n=1 Tax=unclassified Pseudomonas TaxID=196821 RepID=UPI0021148A7B|nr:MULTISPECIES: hypothetical protein [unclassified Pseudomonas]